jgi:uncharacterized phage protein (TIGR01671 family)
MKKTKFRFWDEKEKVMYPAGTINLFLDSMGDVVCYHDGKLTALLNMRILQYTGLNDNNGKEIYEGDIVEYLDGTEWSTESGYDCSEYNNRGVIFFDNECGRYDVTNKEGVSYDDLFDCGIDLVVLGNIYENPDLIKNEV